MKENKTPSCVDCSIKACDGREKNYPSFCLTAKMNKEFEKKVLEIYGEDENQRAMQAAAMVEYEGYLTRTRMEEIVEFAGKIEAKKIGIATCVGLIKEAGIAGKILRSHGFEVFGVACKVGAVEKTKVGIDPICNQIGTSMCNPIMQAKILAEEGTDLNLVVGLCVGHDSLFYKYSQALTTTLITKDRVLGHNPAAALYTADTYYHKLYGED
ncbi:MAG: DUF1847 domain-containing protein [Anaerovoracaceae bacterium]|jgi:uncharacterized metal-binding protein